MRGVGFADLYAAQSSCCLVLSLSLPLFYSSMFIFSQCVVSRSKFSRAPIKLHNIKWLSTQLRTQLRTPRLGPKARSACSHRKLTIGATSIVFYHCFRKVWVSTLVVVILQTTASVGDAVFLAEEIKVLMTVFFITARLVSCGLLITQPDL